MADGSETENNKETKIESKESAAQEVESNATEAFRQDIHDTVGGASSKRESMDKMPADKDGTKRESMDKMPADKDGTKRESMDKMPADKDGIKKESMDKLPADKDGKPYEKDDKNKDGKLDDLAKKMEEELPETEELPTGDVIKRDEDGETLITPNGDEITVNNDGSHSIKGDVKSVDSKDGVTTVTLGDGSTVSFDEQGILSVQRGNQGVAFGRQSYGWGGSGGGGMSGGAGGIGGGGIEQERKPRIEDFLPKIKLK